MQEAVPPLDAERKFAFLVYGVWQRIGPATPPVGGIKRHLEEIGERLDQQLSRVAGLKKSGRNFNPSFCAKLLRVPVPRRTLFVRCRLVSKTAVSDWERDFHLHY
jgi:hypothetical protein